MLDIKALDWQKCQGLIPAIIQESTTGKVLMLGYMNQEALQATLASKEVTFYSRTKQRLWKKGETSGHILKLIHIDMDCDRDTLLLEVKSNGPCCHEGTLSCFKNSSYFDTHFLWQLLEIIANRFQNPQPNSYTSLLFQRGKQRIAQKVGEEGVEVALAAMAESTPEIINETADLLFHLLVLLQYFQIDFLAVLAELKRRNQPQH